MNKKVNIFSCGFKLLSQPVKPFLFFVNSKGYCTKNVFDKNYCLSYDMSSNSTASPECPMDSSTGESKITQTGKGKKSDSHYLRVNEVNIQMLSQPLYDQIFGGDVKNGGNRSKNSKYALLSHKAKNELEKHGLWTEEVNSIPDVCFNLPKLEGKDIEEHFWNIGKSQSKAYEKLMLNFIKRGIPEVPRVWIYQKGWTKYTPNKKPKSVSFPDECALVLDIEVCVAVGESPVLAVAVSSNSWYGWVASSLIDELETVSANRYTTDMLIPLEGKERCKEERIVIGHNVSYDRARIKEQYFLESSALRFIDTMSLHISVGGASSLQKNILKNESEDEGKEILKSTCLTSLKDVYSLYCNESLSKEEREVFLNGSHQDIRNRFQYLMNYCSNDVKATYEVFRVLFPLFLERFPHPVTLAGMLEMGMAYLPVNNNWNKYLRDCAEKFDDLESEMSFLLSKKCDNACRLMHNEAYKNDLWMWNEDWSTQDLKLTKKPVRDNPMVEEILKEDDEEQYQLMKKFKYLFDLETALPAVRPLLPGYPAWYRKLCRKPDTVDWKPGPHLLHTTLTIAPKILNLTYENYPLAYIKEHGWGILVADLNASGKDKSVPYESLKELTLKKIKNYESTSNILSEEEIKDVKMKRDQDYPTHYRGTAVFCGHKVENCCYFLKLPHKDGNNKNVGQPLSKSFSSVFSFNELSGPDSVSQKGLEVNNMLAYWRNNKDRISKQLVVWLRPDEFVSREEASIGVILPLTVVCGTLTRRAVEPTWLTASKATNDRVGSELRAMVQAPPGYHFVGADVDSQELWIASLIGDSSFAKIHGGTPFGWMTISGTKHKGTDLHSMTAKAAGISRDHAKVINYARIYGAGIKFAETLLQKFNPRMSNSEVREKIRKMYSVTKGIKTFKIKDQYLHRYNINPELNPKFPSVYSAIKFAQKYGATVDTMFEHPKWDGGTESAVFNELERIARSEKPETPFLRSRLSRALEPRFDGDDLNINTRINWVVQSGAVDFLHLMLVCMRWLTNGKTRYCLSFHDEVRYLVLSEHRYEAALAMQITNLLTRSFFSHRMGISDLPQSVAFFSYVEIDKVMRKEAYDNCVTPSNPHGLDKGYGIPKGESLNIYEILKKSKGDITVFRDTDDQVVTTQMSLPIQ